MLLSDFNYKLPKGRIAQYPPAVRGSTKLLILDRQTSAMQHRHYSDLADYIEPGDIVVLNNTKVIKARLIAKNKAGQERELLLLEYHTTIPDNHRHRALYRGHLHEGEMLKVQKALIKVEKIIGNGIVEISSTRDLLKLLEQSGTIPLPPYIKHGATPNDLIRYQTEFAKKAGSVAAPTASLNFTDDLRARLESRGVVVVYLTLHVGLGTFMPIRNDDLAQHKMHSEYFEIPQATVAAIQQAKQKGHKVIAVGTTVVRTLEAVASKILADESSSLHGEADIFIYPGYKFKVVNTLLTNFHAPKSTVLMMAAAFAGWQNLMLAYEEALRSGYLFLSYGDSLLIL
jgi:S-adenosylmethionine:tRNA ribosyltransferase-isomerase